MTESSWPLSAGKRLLDILGASAALLILSPLMLFIGVVLYFQLGRPIIFRQVRPGLNSKRFTLLKFRSLRGDRYQTGTATGKIPPTSFCRFLRISGLDELPELLNILKGDMSFVGPRPLLERYLPRYSDEQSKRHNVMPGLTGLAQVNGRNAVSWEKRFEYDLLYVKTASFIMDMNILWQTLTLIIRREGTQEPGEFMGSSGPESNGLK